MNLVTFRGASIALAWACMNQFIARLYQQSPIFVHGGDVVITMLIPHESVQINITANSRSTYAVNGQLGQLQVQYLALLEMDEDLAKGAVDCDITKSSPT